MWSLFKKWMYNLIVKSRLLYRFYHYFYEVHIWYTMKYHNGDTATDDVGCTMNVTRWNKRVVAAFRPRMYSKIKNLNIRKDDIIICGYPKTGCHWIYEIMYMLAHDKAEVSKNGKMSEMIEAMPEIGLDSVPSPRVLNTHVYFDELPEMVRKHTNKIILTIRCPKDTAVSYYNHVKNTHRFYKYDGTFDSFFKMFLKGDNEYGSYFEFYRSWEKAMNQNQIYFLAFEDLKENPAKKIKEIADFLGQPISQDFAEDVAKASSFSKLREKGVGSYMLRKGIVGDWKNWLTDEQVDQLDTVWRQKMTGFKMPTASSKTYCS